MKPNMTEKSTGRPVESVHWDGPDLLITYADGIRETVRFINAFPVSNKVSYPEGSGIVVEELTGWTTDAPGH